MKIQIENLKAQMQGRDLNIYQKADALIEFNKLLDYVEELELREGYHEAQQQVKNNVGLVNVVDSEAELCGKTGCNRTKLDGNVYCSYHYEINFG